MLAITGAVDPGPANLLFCPDRLCRLSGDAIIVGDRFWKTQMRPHPSFISFRRLPARYAGIVTPIILSLVMTFVVSAISTARGVGLTPNFPSLWMSAWGLSWLIAFPTLLMVLPIVRRTTRLIVEPPAL
jgi:uncharacterized protein DUF2798